MINIFAHTARDPIYPPFISFNDKDGILSITIRGNKVVAGEDGEWVDAGPTLTYELDSLHDILDLYEGLGRFIDENVSR